MGEESLTRGHIGRDSLTRWGTGLDLQESVLKGIMDEEKDLDL